MICMAASATLASAKGGFDQFGYNLKARNFVGTGESWAMGKLGITHEDAEIYMGIYAHDQVVMKWNAEWDRGNDEEWADGPYDAWLNNEWNGMVGKAWGGGIVQGSGEVWHYKIVWFGNPDNLPEGASLPDGGYVLWGQFEVKMDQGTSDGVHQFLAKAIPCGYGR